MSKKNVSALDIADDDDGKQGHHQAVTKKERQLTNSLGGGGEDKTLPYSLFCVRIRLVFVGKAVLISSPYYIPTICSSTSFSSSSFTSLVCVRSIYVCARL